jgi:predicted RNA-binding protein with RPS1 domain
MPGMLVKRQQNWYYGRTYPMADKKPKDKKQNEPFKNFEDLAKKLLKVSKEEVDEKREQKKRARGAS